MGTSNRRKDLKLSYENWLRALLKRSLCVYCGIPSSSNDKNVPTTLYKFLFRISEGQKSDRRGLIACGECIEIGKGRLFATLGEKRRFIHANLRLKYSKYLDGPDWLDDEIDELGYNLRVLVESSEDEKTKLRKRLRWPSLTRHCDWLRVQEKY